MTVIVCLDNKNGMLFAGRRQSKDSVLIKDVLDLAGDKKILVNDFSSGLFVEADECINKCDNPLENAEDNDICFVENLQFSSFFGKISRLVVYNWNRAYPCDFYCDIDFSLFSLESEADFSGSSHTRITKRVYVRK